MPTMGGCLLNLVNQPGTAVAGSAATWRRVLAAGRERPGRRAETEATWQPQRRYGRPDQESLSLERGDRDARDVAGAGVGEEPRHPGRAEFRVELIQRVDLEPLRHQQQDPSPGAQRWPGADPLTAFQGGAEDREV